MIRPNAGFTLLELVCVITLMSVGLVGLSRLFQLTREGPLYATVVQNATLLAQECAELVLDTRRSTAYSAVSTSTCNNLSLPSGYTRSLQSASTATSACPSGAACTYWKVAVTAPVDSTNVTTSAVVMLVQY